MWRGISALLFTLVCFTDGLAATVVVYSEPKGADVLVDGEVQGTTPMKLQLKDGSYELTLRKQDYKELTQTVQVEQQMLVLRLTLEERTYFVDVMFKELTDDTMDWYAFSAKVKYIGIVPGTIELPKGKITVLLMKHGFKDIRVTIDTTSEQQVKLEPPSVGQSSLPQLFSTLIIAKWNTGRGWIEFKSNGTYVLKTPYAEYTGIWHAAYPTVTYKQKDKIEPKTLQYISDHLVGSSYAYVWDLVRIP